MRTAKTNGQDRQKQLICFVIPTFGAKNAPKMGHPLVGGVRTESNCNCNCAKDDNAREMEAYAEGLSGARKLTVLRRTTWLRWL